MSYALAIIFGASIIPFVLAYLASKTEREELQILYVSMCLLFITVDFYFLHIIALEGGYTSIANILDLVFAAFFWVFFFVISYFMIMFLKSTFEIGQKNANAGR